jgi:aminoglycoside phosphotransferase (APT) family kinase protein
LQLVHQVFPDAEVVSSYLFAGEHSNLNFELHLTNLMTGTVLKVYLEGSYGESARKETRLLQMLTSETGVPVPRVLHLDDSCDLIPHPWALVTRLPGQRLSEIVDTLDDWELESIGYEMGRYLGHIHQIPLDEFGELFAPDPQNHATEKGHIVAKVAEWLHICSEESLLPVETADALHHLFAGTQLLNRRQACLLHGDFRTENAIVERGTTGYHVTGILEFAYARGGSPELDIAKLFAQSSEGSPAFEKGFLDGYVESGELVAQFWERLRLYQALVCLEQVALAPEKGRHSGECRAWLDEYLDRQSS